MKNFLLLIIASFLFLIIAPIAIFYKLIFSRELSDWFFRVSVSLDQLGNVVGDELFNKVLIKKLGLSDFGNEDETISSVLGKNYLANNLTKAGEILRRILYFLDKNHSVKAIEKDEN